VTRVGGSRGRQIAENRGQRSEGRGQWEENELFGPRREVVVVGDCFALKCSAERTNTARVRQVEDFSGMEDLGG
jgi:hypothetical protein